MWFILNALEEKHPTWHRVPVRQMKAGFLSLGSIVNELSAEAAHEAPVKMEVEVDERSVSKVPVQKPVSHAPAAQSAPAQIHARKSSKDRLPLPLKSSAQSISLQRNAAAEQTRSQPKPVDVAPQRQAVITHQDQPARKHTVDNHNQDVTQPSSSLLHSKQHASKTSGRVKQIATQVPTPKRKRDDAPDSQSGCPASIYPRVKSGSLRNSFQHMIDF